MSVALKHAASFRLPVCDHDLIRAEAPNHPDAALLLAYWRAVTALHGDFRIGRDIPARPIAALLRHIVLQEPVGGGADMRVRLAGSAVRQRFNGKLDGLLLSQVLEPEEFAFKLADSNRVLETGEPSLYVSILRGFAVADVQAEVVVLPIVARDGISPLVLVGVFHFG